MTSLSVVSYIERINRMYRLIRKESTGSRAELAGRMRVSERTVSTSLILNAINFNNRAVLSFSVPNSICRKRMSSCSRLYSRIQAPIRVML